MPLRDHFRPPLSEIASWEGVHGGWPMVIVQHLGAHLPDGFVAEPRVHLGWQVEVDVATFDREKDHVNIPNGIAPQSAWSPSAPSLAVETTLADVDRYEVLVSDVRRGRRLVAAIELLSPANKDRPESRSQFIAKCAALLRQGVSVVMVDVVTSRDFNLYAELLQLIDEADPNLGEYPPATYAAACRWHSEQGRHLLEVWNHTLTVGQPLPRLPLWLAEDLAIPLDLEASYEQTCRDLRIA